MRASPGSSLPIEEILGREVFIVELWRALDRNSVRMEAERRIGKTSILRKMAEQPISGWEVVFMDVEKVHSAAEFAELVSKQIIERLSFWYCPSFALQIHSGNRLTIF